MYELLITVPLMLVLSRMEGGGFYAPKLAAVGLKVAPALLFGMCIGLVHLQPWLVFVICSLLAFWAKNTGHDTTLSWGQPIHPEQAGKTAPLTPIVDWLAARLNVDIYLADGFSHTKNYCRLFMAVKGLCIGFTLFPLGLCMTVLHPLAYEIENKLPAKWRDGAAEMLSGAFTGIIVGVLL